MAAPAERNSFNWIKLGIFVFQIYYLTSKTHGYMASAYLFIHSLNIMYEVLIVLVTRATRATKMEMVSVFMEHRETENEQENKYTK